MLAILVVAMTVAVLLFVFLHKLVKSKTCHLSPTPETDALDIALSLADPADTVVVGALASASQFYVSLSHNFYHAPAALVGDGYKSIKYVAIYQSRRFFGQDAGVRCWGRVASVKRVPRSAITEIDKGGRGLYVRFEIESWQELNPPILPRGKGVTIAFTNYGLLHSARDMNELLGR